MADRLGGKSRILLSGGSGLLALNWACAMRDRWDVVLGTHRHQVNLTGATAYPLHLDEPQLLAREVDEIRPDVIVHTAGMTNVDACESDPQYARQANATLAKNVAEVAATRKIALIHISTDHLFSGTRACYREEDPVEPLNEYARSKLLAEEWVLGTCPEALVIRTNFFGWGHAKRQSFSDWIIGSLREHKELTLFEDVFFTPIIADGVAEIAHGLLARAASGILNVAGDERISKFEFGVRTAREFGLPVELIQRAKVEQLGLRAPRPRDMSLDTTKALTLLNRRPHTIDDYLRRLRDQERSGRREELLRSVT